MTFFSSEEHIKEWEQEHPEFRGSTIDMEQGLGFILTLGATRGDYNYAPLAPTEVHQAFERYGFVGEFWKLPE
jgi:hypothetical protein